MSVIAVVTTVGSVEAARDMARAIVEEGLAACAQIQAIESLYRWDGAVQHEPEWRIVFKTVADRWAGVETAIRARHPYALPEIHAHPLEPVHAAYADWVQAQCAKR